MRKERIHNGISKSTATLFVASLAALLMWWPTGEYSTSAVVSLALASFIGYMLVETDIVFQLLRVRSRMIASVWLFSVACVASVHTYQPSLVAAALLAVSYHLLFRTYQTNDPVVDTFHSYCLLAIASIFYSPVLLLVPFYIWYQLVFLRCLSLRTFCAAMLGVVSPLWFWGMWMLWREDVSPLLSWWTTIRVSDISFAEFLGIWNRQFIVGHADFLLFAALGLWTSVDYLFKSFDDKIRTRMMLYIYVFQFMLILIYAVCRPQQMDQLIPMLLLNASVPLAHYFTFRTSWFSVGLFVLSVLALLVLALVKIYGNVPIISEYLTIFARFIERLL